MVANYPLDRYYPNLGGEIFIFLFELPVMETLLIIQRHFMKVYFVCCHQNCLIEPVLMKGHNDM